MKRVPDFNVCRPCRHGLMVYNPNDMYVGRSLDLYGEYSWSETDIFEQLVRPGHVVIEVGANIGAHTIRLAQLVGPAGRVFAFEPQRVIFQTLCGNLALNSLINVDAFNLAVGSEVGDVSVPVQPYWDVNNYGSVELGDGTFWRDKKGITLESVQVITLDVAFSCPRLDFLKVDVEGMEYDVLSGARETILKHRPILFFENDRVEKSERLIDLVRGMGYLPYWHDAPFFREQNYRANPRDVYEGAGSINVLALHETSAVKLEGFRPVDDPVYHFGGKDV